MAGGTRIIDLPHLATVADTTEFVASNEGTGVVTGVQVKDYVLGAIPGSTEIVELRAQVDTLTADGLETSSAIISLGASKASASALTALETTVGEHTASIINLSTTTGTQAETLSTLQSKTNANTATLTTLSSVNSTLGATYNLKTDVNGYVVGFGLTNTGTATGSEVTFTTDKFRIVGTGEGASASPVFETVSGVTYIRNAVIGTARIGTDNLASAAATAMVTAQNAPTLYGNNGVVYNVFNFTFNMPHNGQAIFLYTAYLPSTGPFRVDFYVDGSLRTSREGQTSQSAAIIHATDMAAGTHTVAVAYTGNSTSAIADQYLVIFQRWR